MAKGKKYGGRKKGTPNKNAQHGDFHLKQYARESLVYLLKANDRYKIGMTTNMEIRFKKCIGLCPYPLYLIWTLKTKDCRKIEKGLHRIFKNKRIHYEWFLLNEDDVNQIIKIKSIDDLSYIGEIFNYT
jgi:hypothetical protein